MLDYDGINRLTFRSKSWLACAFLICVPETAPASLRVLSANSSDRPGARLDRVLSKTGEASLRSYNRGSYKTTFTVEQGRFVPRPREFRCWPILAFIERLNRDFSGNGDT